eukprot:CAMPEP_0118924314 /NCGR_PEP_ID=MMETSP1169-20130426/2500_1 /TAXON_ID=36882 /ORGANISM="Pyramimonas obovata, Strain CCMP722" /LENGTH=1526 /DNA_ID=CAMNT_0006865411 /DNA_START=128 /DNA_END=4708 /DNA_ORIENTATION=+
MRSYALLSLLVGCMAQTVVGDPVALLPSTLYSGLSSDFSVHGATEDMVISLRRTATSGVVIVDVAVPLNAGAQTLSLAVPGGLEAGSYSLLMSTASGALVSQTSVKVEASDYFLLIEPDKLVYKPGQTVRARVLAVDPHLLAAPSKEVIVEVKDPNDFIVERWTSTLDEHGVGLFEMPISDEPLLGDYVIKARSASGDVMKEQTITLDKYVLPRYEVSVAMVQEMYTANSVELKGTVDAKYTTGRDVQGTVDISIVYTPSSGWWGVPFRGAVGGFAGGFAEDVGIMPPVPNEPKVIATSTNLEIDGSREFTFDGSDLAAGISSYNGHLTVQVTVLETATRETQEASADVPLRSHDYKVDLEGAASFMPGLTYEVKVFVTPATPSLPLPSRVKLAADLRTYGYGNPLPVSGFDTAPYVDLVNGAGTYVVDLSAFVDSTWERCNPSNGVSWGGEDDMCLNFLQFTVDGESMERDGAVMDAAVDFSTLSASRALSASGSYVQVARQDTDMPNTVQFAITHTSSQATEVHYAVLGRLGVLAAGSSTIDGSGTASLAIDPKRASPSAHLLVWYTSIPIDERQAPELIAAQIPIESTASPLEYSVSAAFSETEVVPGADLQMTVTTDTTATAPTRVYYLAVDRSVLLLSGGASSAITADAILGGALSFSSSGEECYGVNAAAALAAAGAAVITTATVPECPANGGGDVFFGGGLEMEFDDMAREAMADFPATAPTGVLPTSSEPLTEVSRVRKFFPEAWLWAAVDVDSSGSVQVPMTAPDTITTWELSAFGVNADAGVGVAAERATLTVFKDFFVELALPYQIVRGEAAVVRVGVFNELDAAVDVTVELSASSANAQVLDTNRAKTVSVPAQSTASVTFVVEGTGLGTAELEVTAQTPASVGKSDAVRKTLIVAPEGLKRTQVANLVMQRGEGDATLDHTLEVTLPAEFVADSASAKLTVIGDLMGPTVAGLEQLLQMPFGCGEQNMITLAPNVYVLRYLTDAGKLDAATRERAVRNMKMGYQRELNYRHEDGSFSAFGPSDGDGSTWLTAFVLKVFSQAEDFIFVDTALLQDMVNWLSGLQATDGSFRDSGKVIHSEMQGGTGSGTSLTAYVVTALVSAHAVDGVSVSTTVIGRAMDYLISASTSSSATTFVQVISASALALVCKDMSFGCSASAAALDRIQALATVEGSLTHWEPSPSEALTLGDSHRHNFYGGAPTTHIEMTGYGLLAMVTGDRVGDAFPVARWLLEQRNSFGGFSSTQDTVLGLEALSMYTVTVSAAAGTLTVEATAGSWSHTFTVGADNFDVLQRQDVPTTGNTSVALRVTGAGIGLVQLSAEYYEDAESAEAYDVTTSWENVTGIDRMVGTACVKLADSAASGPDPGMVLVTVGCFTGYTPTQESLRTLLEHPQVDRADVSTTGNSAEIYLSALHEEELCLTFHAERTAVVYELRPAMTKVAAYYKDTMVGVSRSRRENAQQAGDLDDTPPPGAVGGDFPSPPPPGTPPDSSADYLVPHSLQNVLLAVLGVMVMLS